jgi:predicted nucleic acid-binding protein
VSRFVVDASVAAKWLIPEPLSEAALRLRNRDYALFCPDLLYLEVGNVLWKKVRSGEIREGAARPLLRALLEAPLRAESSVAILPAAWEISVRYARSVYDSLYLALSLALDARLVTADRRFLRALSPTPLADRIVWVEELPS